MHDRHGELIPEPVEDYLGPSRVPVLRWRYTCGCVVEYCDDGHWHWICSTCGKRLGVKMSGEIPWHPTKGRGRGGGCPESRFVVEGLSRRKKLPPLRAGYVEPPLHIHVRADV